MCSSMCTHSRRPCKFDGHDRAPVAQVQARGSTGALHKRGKPNSTVHTTPVQQAQAPPASDEGETPSYKDTRACRADAQPYIGTAVQVAAAGAEQTTFQSVRETYTRPTAGQAHTVLSHAGLARTRGVARRLAEAPEAPAPAVPRCTPSQAALQDLLGDAGLEGCAQLVADELVVLAGQVEG